MSKNKRRGLSRREFLEVSMGVVAGGGAAAGCSSDSGTSESGAAGDTSAVGSGGMAPGVGGSGTGGGVPGQGGTGVGGAPQGTGGVVQGSGGVVQGSGGLVQGSGGAVSITGGAPGAGGLTLGTGGDGTGGDGIGGLDQGTGGDGAGGLVQGTGGDGTGGATAGAGGDGTGGATAGAGGDAGSAGTATGGEPASGGSAGQGGAGGQTSTGALVSIARAATIDQAAADAIAMAGGLGFVSGGTVMLKPNLNSGDPAPCAPSPEVMSTVIQMCFQAGANRVIVADRSNPQTDAISAMQLAGWYQLIQDLGAEPLNLDGEPSQLVTPAGATNWPGGFNMYSLLFDGTVDHLINVCCAKDHASQARYTMALKAWMGIIEQDNRMTAHQDLGNRLPELHLGRREDFVVLDASRCNLTNGPYPGEQADSNLIVASTDPIAVDATGVAVLKYWMAQRNINNNDIRSIGVWDQPQIARALQIGIGISSPSEYSQQSQGVSEIDDILAMMA
jgi:uncharacterized protein (DUF362 family)